MAAGFITGLLGGLEKNRAEEQFKLTERKARGQEIDIVQREARRIADTDAADEQQTMTQLMNPGLHPDSRNAIVSNRNARRQQNQSYIQSLQGDPDKAGDIKARYGDLSQMLSPSSIGTGNLPKPTMDLPTILSFLEKENKNIRGMGSEANKRDALARARGVATDVYGAAPNVVDKYLPQFGSETSRTPGKISDYQAIDDIAGLDPSLRQGGKLKLDTGVTLETAMQGDKLMKRYVNPDIITSETYEQPEKEALAAQKAKLDIPFLQARMDQIKAKTAAIPQEVDLKYKKLFADIKNKDASNALRRMAIGVSQQANSIRMWGLQNTHTRGMMGLSMRGQSLDLGERKFAQSQRDGYLKRLDDLSKELDGHIGKAAKGQQLGQPQVAKAEMAIIDALKKQVDNAKMYVQNADNPDFNAAYIDSELDEGGFTGRPSRMLGLPAGTPTYNAGGYSAMTPEQMAAYMARAAGGNMQQPSPLYGGGVFAGGGSGGVPQGYAATQAPATGGQPKMIKVAPSGYVAGAGGPGKYKARIDPTKTSEKDMSNYINPKK